MPSKILLHTALTIEAKPIIKILNLKRDFNWPLPVYHNSQFSLICSGIGKLATATACGALISEMLIHLKLNNIYFLNVGFAAADSRYSIGTPVLINKVTSLSNDTKFYPDMLIKHDFIEEELFCSDVIINDEITSEGLYDMESIGFCSAVKLFLPPSRFGLLKIVSDHGHGEMLSKKWASETIEAIKDPFLKYLNVTYEFLNKYQPEWSDKSESRRLNEIAEYLNLSKTQIDLLRNASKSYFIRHKNLPELNLASLSRPGSKYERNKTFDQVLQLLAR